MNRATSFEGDGRESIGRLLPARPIEVTTEDEHEFRLAMEEYKRQSGRLFPTWSEILEVLRSLGYAKRIWKPVGPWAPLPAMAVGHGEDSIGMVGWFARVETPVGS